MGDRGEPPRGADRLDAGRVDRREVRERILRLRLDRHTQVQIRATLAGELGRTTGDAEITRLTRSVVEGLDQLVKPGAYRHQPRSRARRTKP